MLSPTAIAKPLHFFPASAGGASPLAQLLAKNLRGDVLFDSASRGRYSTDASIYQITPIGVVVPRDQADVLRALEIARDQNVAVLSRGAGTSQCGQTVGDALIIDNSKWLCNVIAFDANAMTITVEPGMVLDHLNAWLKPHGLWFPVDVSTSAQCTIGGMTGNNSCGSRSIEYGNMVHNVLSVDAVLADCAHNEEPLWTSCPRAGLLQGRQARYMEHESAFGELHLTSPDGQIVHPLDWQTARFTELATGPLDEYVVPLRPEQVVEIAIDGLQRSTRYPGGLALRFAAFHEGADAVDDLPGALGLVRGLAQGGNIAVHLGVNGHNLVRQHRNLGRIGGQQAFADVGFKDQLLGNQVLDQKHFGHLLGHNQLQTGVGMFQRKEGFIG